MIQPRVIRAIEAGNLKELPEGVYIRGFLRRYADALGLDGHALASEFPLEPQDAETGRDGAKPDGRMDDLILA